MPWRSTHIHKAKKKNHSTSDQSFALKLPNKRIMCPGSGRGDTEGGERHSNYHLHELRNGSPEIWKSSLKHFLIPLTSAHWISWLIPSSPLCSLTALSRFWFPPSLPHKERTQARLLLLTRTIILTLSLPSVCLSTSVLSPVSTRGSYC